MNLRPLPFVLAASLVVALTGHAAAQTMHTVTSLLDSGPGSLREAVSTAGAGDTVAFEEQLAGYTVVLAAPLLIEADLTVRGPEAAPVTLSGVDMTELFEVRGGAEVTFERLSFADGYATSSDSAGGIHIHGKDTEVTFASCRFTRNTGDATRFTAGAMRVAGGAAVTVRDSEFLNNMNTVADIRGSGDILVLDASLSVTRTRFHDHDHGALPSAPASIYFDDESDVELIATLHHPDSRNAVYTVDDDSTLYMENCTVYARWFNGVIAGATTEIHACTFIGASDEDLLHNHAVTIGGSVIGIHEQLSGGNVTSLGGNVVTDTNISWGGSDIVGSTVDFEPLADNGGPLPTFAPSPGSVALDAGFYSGSPSHDARGYLRTDVRDAGAFDGRAVGFEPVPSVLQAGVAHTVHGANLDEIIEIRAGGEVADVVSQNETTLTFAPARTSTLGSVNLELDADTGSVWSDSFEVELTEPPPVITSASPDPAEPEETLSLEGDWLDQVSAVTVGGVAATIDTAGFDELEVTLDASTPGGPQVIAVTTPFGTDTSVAVYVDAPQGGGGGNNDDNGGCVAGGRGAPFSDTLATATVLALLLLALVLGRRLSLHGCSRFVLPE